MSKAKTWAAFEKRCEAALDVKAPLEDALHSVSEVVTEPEAVLFLALVLLRPRATEKLPSGHRGPITITDIGKAPGRFLFAIRSDDDHLRDRASIPVRLDVSDGGRLGVLVTVAHGPHLRAAVERFIDAAYPRLYRPFLRQSEMRSVADALQAGLQSTEELRVTQVSSKRRLLHSSSRRQYQSERAWTDKAYVDAFQEADENLAYFRSIRFEVCRPDEDGRLQSMQVQGTLSQSGVLSTNMRPGWLTASGFPVARAHALKQAEFAQDRSRKPSTPAPRTIVANFSEQDAIERKDLPELVKLLRKMPRASVSVIHGNPYLHARVVDFHDGSSFDLILVSARRLLVVPTLRATESAVTRICHYVYEQIGEAEFVDAAE